MDWTSYSKNTVSGFGLWSRPSCISGKLINWLINYFIQHTCFVWAHIQWNPTPKVLNTWLTVEKEHLTTQKVYTVTHLTNWTLHPMNSLLSTASPAVSFCFLCLNLAVPMLHMQGILLYPSFWGWLISFTIMSSRFIHHIEHGRISLFCFVTERSGKIKYLHTKEMKFNTVFMSHTKTY